MLRLLSLEYLLTGCYLARPRLDPKYKATELCYRPSDAPWSLFLVIMGLRSNKSSSRWDNHSHESHLVPTRLSHPVKIYQAGYYGNAALLYMYLK